MIVTGAASGIGAAAARRFAREGARLALCDLDEGGLASELDPGGDRVATRVLDVSAQVDVEAFVDGGPGAATGQPDFHTLLTGGT